MVAILQDIAATGSQKKCSDFFERNCSDFFERICSDFFEKSCSDLFEQYFFQRNLNKIFSKKSELIFFKEI